MILATDVMRTRDLKQRQVRVQRPNTTITPTTDEYGLRNQYTRVRASLPLPVDDQCCRVLAHAIAHACACQRGIEGVGMPAFGHCLVLDCLLIFVSKILLNSVHVLCDMHAPDMPPCQLMHAAFQSCCSHLHRAAAGM